VCVLLVCRVVKLTEKKINHKTLSALRRFCWTTVKKNLSEVRILELVRCEKVFCVSSLHAFCSAEKVFPLLVVVVVEISRINITDEFRFSRKPKWKNIQINLPSSSDGKLFFSLIFQRILFNQWKALKRRKHEIGKDSTNLKLKLCRANFRSAERPERNHENSRRAAEWWPRLKVI
jgi:hypothetical protein